MDELAFQDDETSNVLLVRRIEHLECLADTSIIKVLDDNDIQPLLDDDDEHLDPLEVIQKITTMTMMIQTLITITNNVYYFEYTMLRTTYPQYIITLIL